MLSTTACSLATEPTTCFLLPTTYHLLPASYHLSPTTYHLPPTTHHLLPTANCLLPTAYLPTCLLPTYLLLTTNWLLPTAHCLQRTCLLPTTYLSTSGKARSNQSFSVHMQTRSVHPRRLRRFGRKRQRHRVRGGEKLPSLARQPTPPFSCTRAKLPSQIRQSNLPFSSSVVFAQKGRSASEPRCDLTPSLATACSSPTRRYSCKST